MYSVRETDGSALASEVPEDGFPPISEQGAFDNMENPVSSEGETDRTGWERSRPDDHAMRLLTVDVSSSWHGFSCRNTLHALGDDKLFE